MLAILLFVYCILSYLIYILVFILNMKLLNKIDCDYYDSFRYNSKKFFYVAPITVWTQISFLFKHIGLMLLWSKYLAWLSYCNKFIDYIFGEE